MARAFVGTSGWSYAHWRNDFYPPGLSARKWLPYLAQHFDTVEVNASFYRLPKREWLDHWVQQVPKGFTFAAKLWRGVTHYRKLRDVDDMLETYFGILAHIPPRHRAPILVQLPPHLPVQEDRLDPFLGRMRAIGGPRWRVAVEFRHASWLTPRVRQVLDRHDAALCVHDMQEQGAVVDPNQASFVYVRRHGQASRYSGSYGAASIRRDADDVQGWLDDGRDAYVYYNNDMHGHAPRDALHLKAVLAGAPVPAFVRAAAPAQGAGPPAAARQARRPKRPARRPRAKAKATRRL